MNLVNTRAVEGLNELESQPFDSKRDAETFRMLRKGQVSGVPKGDVPAQLKFMAQILGVAA